MTRLDNNIAALEILRDVEKNPRTLTDDEKTKLANYVGWGALSRVFDEDYLKESYYERHPERAWEAERAKIRAEASEKKHWRDAHAKLKELLSTEEFNAARASTINAHYTSPELVRFMWDAVQKMGFKSGNVLDPSIGVGNFFGMMPPAIRANVNAVGNDMDPVTSGIAKLLYPGATIFNKPFEDLVMPNNEIDLAISNVPFFEGIVHDPKYPKLKANLHDYFFVKSLDKVKPGGLIAFITSTGTMDKQSSAIRDALAAQADLVTAYRLPSSAFKATAGTEVTTDVIFLRKRLPDEKPAGEPWVKSTVTSIPIDKGGMHEMAVNEYFQAHHDHMLGIPVASTKMYGGMGFMLKPGKESIEEQLQKALADIPKGVMKPASVSKPSGLDTAATEDAYAPDNIKEYQYVIDKGAVKQNRMGKLVPAAAVLDKNGKMVLGKKDRIKAMVGLRDKLNALMANMATLPDDDEANSTISKQRAELLKSYNSFVHHYGLLNSTANGIFREDPHYPRLLALENYDRAKKLGTPADIFRKRTRYPRAPLKSVSSDPKEALQQILGERGYADINLMAQLQGKEPKDAAKELIAEGLIFRDPVTGEYQTKERYLSGYVRSKLDDARAAVAQGSDEYKGNVTALEKVQPEDLHITSSPDTSISVRLGGTWIPIPALEDFFKDTFKTNANFKYENGVWSIPYVENPRTPAITTQFATKRSSATELLTDSLNLKQTTIYDTDRDGNRHLNAEETTASRAMQETLRNEFQKWALEGKWKEPLEKAYNYAFNNIVEAEYDGSHLTFPGMNPEIQLKPHQINAVWRMIQDGRALLAHEVGAGKTFEMVAAVMEGRRTGVFKKPMIAVPNHIVDQFRKEFLLLYPGANILVPTEKDFDSKNRQRVMSQIATGDYDAIILPHSQFNLMDISPERMAKTMQHEMDELEETLRALKQADPKGQSRSVKQMEKSKLKLKEKLKALADLAADKAINFDDTGIDALFIDEAHEYKNLAFYTKMTRISGLQQGNAKRASRLKAKTDYLQETNHGRGVFFATGTPVQNTMAELYTMIKYVAPDVLERAGIRFFDDWAANFGSTITAMELSADGRSFKARTKFARFQNVPELMQMFRTFADVKSAADLALPRPELEGGKPIVVTVPGSDKLDEYVKQLMDRAERVRSGGVDPKTDNMLKITSEGRKAATDMRLLDQAIKDEQESKINVAVQQMLREYRAGDAEKLTQMAFLDMYRALDADENELINLYDDMRKKLIAGGVKPEEVAVIGEHNTRLKRQALFDKMNKGEVRILLGSTQKMGSGTNAQKKMKALHHIDLTWRPGDLTQREGRILRQGNDNKEVRIYNYLTERSFDAYMAQTLQSKAEFLSQMLGGKNKSRTMTDAAADMVMSLEEMKVAASGNPDVKLKYDLEMKQAQLETVERSFDTQNREARYQIKSIELRNSSARGQLAKMEKAQATIEAVEGKDGNGFSMEVDGKKFNERKAAFEYLKAMAVPNGSFWIQIDGINVSVGHTTQTEFEIVDGKAIGKNVPKLAYSFDFSELTHNAPDNSMDSLGRSMESRLRNLSSDISLQKRGIKDREEELPTFQKIADRKEFPEKAELDKVRKELAEVEKRLGLGNVNAGSQADAEEIAASVEDEAPEAEPAEKDEDEDEEDDDIGGETAPTKPKPSKDDLSATMSAFGFANPAVFQRLFPRLAQSISEWSSDTPTTAQEEQELLRQKAGEMDRSVAMAVFQLRKEAKEWTTRPRSESIMFWNDVESGQTVRMGSRDRALADTFKAAFDSMKEKLQELKPEILQNYIENYYPHIWKQPSNAAKVMKGLLTGKRPLAGKASFLKKRTIPTMQDGLDLGFEPLTWNPVEAFLLKYAEMAQFLMAHQTLDVMKMSGTAKYVPISGKGKPDGWVQLDDRIGTVYRHVTAIDEDKLEDVTQPLTFPGGKREIPGAFSEDIEDATHGEIALVGHYYAPREVAKVFNAYVSKGLAGRYAIFDFFKSLNSNLNALQLGISAFHASMITAVGAVSDIALGIQQLTEGKPVSFATSVAAGFLFPISAFNTVRNGYRLMHQYVDPGSYIGMAREADSIAVAGGRIKENTFKINGLRRAINAFSNKAYGEGLSAIPGAILQTFTGPIMEHYVPIMKMGIFYGMAHDILDEHSKGKLTLAQVRTRLDEAWNSVDNRAGQMVYRNLFWNKAVLDVLQVGTRSVGWNWGTIAEALGAAVGIVKAAGSIVTEKKPRMSPSMAFALALPMTVGMWGAAQNYLRTGHAPETLKDYYYIREANGTYLSPPTYIKDVFSYAHDPVATLGHKTGPLLEATIELVQNKDFYGTEIRHTDDPAWKQLAEVGEWAAKQAIPFSFSSAGRLLENEGAQETLISMFKEARKHPMDLMAGQLGFQQAPAFIQNSDALNAARDYEKENAPAGTRTKEAAARTHAMHVIEDMYRRKQVDKEAIDAFKKSGTIKETDLVAARFYSRTDPLVRAVRPLHVDQAIEVYLKATPAEKKTLRPVIEEKQREINKFTNNPETRDELRKAYHDALNPAQKFSPQAGQPIG